MSSLMYVSMYILMNYASAQLVQARRGGALDLLVERAGGRGPEPARHDVGRSQWVNEFVGVKM